MISYKDIALQIFSYSSEADYNCYRVIANFVSNFVGIATGISKKKQLATSDRPFPKPLSPYRFRLKNLEKIFYGSRVTVKFVLNFVANAIGSIQWLMLFSMCHSLHVAVNKCIN